MEVGNDDEVVDEIEGEGVGWDVAKNKTHQSP
jgi:hypothetical protein